MIAGVIGIPITTEEDMVVTPMVVQGIIEMFIHVAVAVFGFLHIVTVSVPLSQVIALANKLFFT